MEFSWAPAFRAWLGKHKKYVVPISAVITGAGVFILTSSPPILAIYTTTGLLCHFFASQTPRLCAIYAYLATSSILSIYDAIERNKSLGIPHISNYPAATVPLTIAACLMMLGVGLCELCGSWIYVRHVVRGMEVSTVGMSVYAICAGNFIPGVGVLWRYATAFQAANVVFQGGTFLDGKYQESRAKLNDEKEKDGSQV